ncbi:hypothetical protein HK102_012974, partial [Quaeritorhiza haematococci]
DQPGAGERGDAALAQVRGQDVQLGLVGQFVEAGVAVEVLLVMVFQHAGPGVAAVDGPARQPSRGRGQDGERIAADDPIADVHPDEVQDLLRGLVELLGGAVVAVPVEHEVSGEDAPAGDRRDVRDVLQGPGVAEEADDAEVGFAAVENHVHFPSSGGSRASGAATSDEVGRLATPRGPSSTSMRGPGRSQCNRRAGVTDRDGRLRAGRARRPGGRRRGGRPLRVRGRGATRNP